MTTEISVMYGSEKVNRFEPKDMWPVYYDIPGIGRFEPNYMWPVYSDVPGFGRGGGESYKWEGKK